MPHEPGIQPVLPATRLATVGDILDESWRSYRQHVRHYLVWPFLWMLVLAAGALGLAQWSVVLPRPRALASFFLVSDVLGPLLVILSQPARTIIPPHQPGVPLRWWIRWIPHPFITVWLLISVLPAFLCHAALLNLLARHDSLLDFVTASVLLITNTPLLRVPLRLPTWWLLIGGLIICQPWLVPQASQRTPWQQGKYWGHWLRRYLSQSILLLTVLALLASIGGSAMDSAVQPIVHFITPVSPDPLFDGTFVRGMAELLSAALLAPVVSICANRYYRAWQAEQQNQQVAEVAPQGICAAGK